MSLYERLGGVYPIALVVDRFSNQLLSNPIVGSSSENIELQQWDTKDYLTRLPGLKFMRTLWLCTLAGGPFQYTGKSLRDAHCRLHIKPEQFDAVAQELLDTLVYYNIPLQEQKEVLTAFMAQKADVTACARPNVRESNSVMHCPFGTKI